MHDTMCFLFSGRCGETAISTSAIPVCVLVPLCDLLRRNLVPTYIGTQKLYRDIIFLKSYVQYILIYIVRMYDKY